MRFQRFLCALLVSIAFLPLSGAAQAPGSISGTVVSATGGSPLPGVDIYIYQYIALHDYWSSYWAAQTDLSGHYTISNLSPDGYRVEFRDNSGIYAPEFYDNSPDAASAQAVLVGPGANVTGIDAALAGATISGQVTALEGGGGLHDVIVDIYRFVNGSWQLLPNSDVTDNSGDYMVKGLPPGSYRVGFRGPIGDHAPEFHENALTADAAQRVDLGEGSNLIGIDAALAGATISGNVTAGSGGAQLEGVVVSAYRLDSGYWQQMWWVNPVVTDASGNYTVKGLPPGTYRVGFVDPAGEYAPEFLNNALTLEAAQNLSVVDKGADITGIDVALADASTITGRVTANNGGASLAGIDVTFYRFAHNSLLPTASAVTDASGDYVVKGLPRGVYWIFFRDPTSTYVQKYYKNSPTPDSAKKLPVAEGEDLTGVDVALDDAATIRGTVTEVGGGSALPGINVVAYHLLGTYWQQIGASGVTDVYGEYAVKGLPAGVYRVGFVDPSSQYGYESFDNSATVEAGIDVPVAVGADVSGVNAEVTGAATISGKVTSARGGVDLGGIIVELSRRVNGSWQLWRTDWGSYSATTDSSGQYLVRGLSPGTYRVGFSDWSGNHAPQFFGNALTVEAGQNVVLVASQAATNIDVALAKGASISGRVTAENGGVSLRGVDVSVYRFTNGSWQPSVTSVATDPFGDYTMKGLLPGTYRVGVSDPSGRYAPAFHSNASTIESGQSVVLVEDADVTGINVSLGDAATISGTVTANNGGGALQGVSVNVYRLDNGTWQQQWSSSAVSDSLGNYTVPGLPPGTYRVEFTDSSDEHASEFYSDALTVEAASSVTVPRGQDVTEINAALSEAATVSGRVTALHGGGDLHGIIVSVYRFINGSWQQRSNWGMTDASGDYTVRGLVPGTYRIGFNDPSGVYAPEFHSNALTVEAGQSLELTEGADVTGIDAALSDAATISGRVTAVDSGGGLQGVSVTVYRSVSGSWQSLWWLGATVTDVSGNYTVRGLVPGSYRIGFADPSGVYEPEFHSNALTVESGQSVELAEGADVTGIDAALLDAATISGKVTAVDGGGVLQGVNVSVYRFINGSWQQQSNWGITDASGDYTVRGLVPGSYRISFVDPSGAYAPEFHSNALAVEAGQSVELSQGADVTGIDAALLDAATISGRVTAVDGGGALQGVNVSVYRFINGSWQLLWWSGATVTDVSGHYIVRGLVPGSYRIGFTDPSGAYAYEFYNDALTVETGQSVLVSSGQAVSNINVALSNGATISGRVTAQAGGAVSEGIQVQAYLYDVRLGYWNNVWSGNTDSYGNYAVRALPAGSYHLEFRDPAGTYALEYYNDAVTLGTGQGVSVVSGQAVSNINVALSSGVTISGRVTAQTGGAVLEGIQVEVYRYDTSPGYWSSLWTGNTVFTDSLGNYTVRGLPAGSYRLEFRDPAGTYAQEYYSDAVTVEAGQSVSVALGQTVSNINVALSNGATISGRVTVQAGGAFLEGIQVEVYRYDYKQDYWHSLWMLAAFTDPSGNYVIGGLPFGTYRLGFWDPSGKYAQEFYSNALNVETAQDLPLAEGQSSTGVDVALSSGASISGTVTADSTGSPLEGVRVGLFSYDPVAATWNYHWIGSTPVTDELGRYVISGLGAGTYRVGFQETNLDYGMKFYTNAGSAETATNVTVGTGSQVDGIDVSLGNATKISGTVTAKSGGAPLPSVVVAIYRYEDSVGEWNYVETVRNFTTDELGNYSIPGLPPGTYSLEFRDTKDVYATQFYSNSPSTAAATSISLTPGQELADLNVALADGGSISGLVVKEDGTSPLKGALVKAHLLVDGLWHEVWQQRELSGQNGAFSIVGLSAGTYRLEITDLSGQYATEFYLDAKSFAAATSIQLNTGEDRSVETVVMGAAASFSGAVTGPDGVTPLQGVSVVPHRWNQSSQVWEPLTSTRTHTNGSFKSEGLPPGTYAFEFVDQSGVHLGEFFNNSPNLTAAIRIELQPGQKFQGAQIALALAGYDSWKASYGVTGSQSSDDDGDGLSNGAEYALGTHPKQADANQALKFQISGSVLTLEFLKRNHGAINVLQEITDLRNGTWVPSQASMAQSPDQTGVGIGYTRMRSVVPGTGRKFFRIRAAY